MPLSASPSLRRARRAFTIIELLVALGITAVMVTLMVNISINMLKAWNTSGGRLSSGGQARIALDYLSQDLQSAVLKRDSNIWLAASVQRDQTGNGDAAIVAPFNSAWVPTNPKPSGSGAAAEDNSLDLGAARTSLDPADRGKIENTRFGRGGVWLRLFANPPDTNIVGNLATLSAPRAVSYQISRGQIGSNTSGQYVYALFRSEVTPNLTFASGYNITAAAYDTAAGANGIIRRPTAAKLLANNVVDFGVRFFERDSTGALYESFPVRRLPPVAPATVGVGTPLTTVPVHYLATSSTAASYTSFGGGTLLPSGGTPVVAEIMLRILTPEGQRLLHAFEEGTVSRPPGVANNDTYWWQLVTQNSQVFTRRVELRATAL
jgi:Prokaryotic N-terminal methylation motif